MHNKIHVSSMVSSENLVLDSLANPSRYSHAFSGTYCKHTSTQITLRNNRSMELMFLCIHCYVWKCSVIRVCWQWQTFKINTNTGVQTVQCLHLPKSHQHQLHFTVHYMQGQTETFSVGVWVCWSPLTPGFCRRKCATLLVQHARSTVLQTWCELLVAPSSECLQVWAVLLIKCLQWQWHGSTCMVDSCQYAPVCITTNSLYTICISFTLSETCLHFWSINNRSPM